MIVMSLLYLCNPNKPSTLISYSSITYTSVFTLDNIIIWNVEELYYCYYWHCRGPGLISRVQRVDPDWERPARRRVEEDHPLQFARDYTCAQPLFLLTLEDYIPKDSPHHRGMRERMKSSRFISIERLLLTLPPPILANRYPEEDLRGIPNFNLYIVYANTPVSCRKPILSSLFQTHNLGNYHFRHRKSTKETIVQTIRIVSAADSRPISIAVYVDQNQVSILIKRESEEADLEEVRKERPTKSSHTTETLQSKEVGRKIKSARVERRNNGGILLAQFFRINSPYFGKTQERRYREERSRERSQRSIGLIIVIGIILACKCYLYKAIFMGTNKRIIISAQERVELGSTPTAPPQIPIEQFVLKCMYHKLSPSNTLNK
uniref:Uncharacterized protein n=1 Tax=Heterorhabditis bacteriophora TaxID=37862 RepID=A0A1I7WGN5_HETBA